MFGKQPPHPPTFGKDFPKKNVVFFGSFPKEKAVSFKDSSRTVEGCLNMSTVTRIAAEHDICNSLRQKQHLKPQNVFLQALDCAYLHSHPMTRA